MKAKCENCNWKQQGRYRYSGESKGKISDWIECHRHSAVLVPHPDMSDGWPIVLPDDWCGEYEAIQ